MITKNKLFASVMSLVLTSAMLLSGCSVKTENIPEIVTNTKGSEQWQTKIDYSDKNNWLATAENGDKKVDLIYYYPTCFTPSEDSDVSVSSIDDENMRKLASSVLSAQASAFADSCNVYAPFYRQVDAGYGLTITNQENSDLFRYSASQDPTAALDYYFKHYNNGKPFILAGHSQGSEILTFILGDYMKEHPDYYKRMIAAYVIGYSVTDDYLNKYTHLKFAEGADDTGVIISWNTEGAENIDKHNAVVLEGAKSINPINWKTDETPASVSENLGSFIDGQMVDGVADATVNTKRGVVITTADKKYAMVETMSSIFGPACFHSNDYQFYYANIKENCQRRINAYFQKNAK